MWWPDRSSYILEPNSAFWGPTRRIDWCLFLLIPYPYFSSGAQYRSTIIFKTCMWNLVRNGVGLTWFGRPVVKIEVLKFSWKFHLIWCSIHSSRCYFSDLIARASSYDVLGLACMFGLEPRGLGWVSDRLWGVLHLEKSNFSTVSGAFWFPSSRSRRHSREREVEIGMYGFFFFTNARLGRKREAMWALPFVNATSSTRTCNVWDLGEGVRHSLSRTRARTREREVLGGVDFANAIRVSWSRKLGKLCSSRTR